MLEKASKPPFEEHGRSSHGAEEKNGESEPGVYGKHKEKHPKYREAEVRDLHTVPPEHFVIPLLQLVC